MPLSPNLRGALFMSIAMAGFTMNDAITKFVSGEMNLAQIMLVRGLFAVTLISLLAWRQRALRPLRTMLQPMVALRVISEAGATVSFLLALSHMPLANVSAILQALPLAVTMGAALFFAEPVGWRRWLAIVAGFIGVMIVVRPGFEGFNVFAIFALVCVVICAVRDLATRRIPADIPSLFVSTATAGVVAVAGAVLVAPFGGWSPLSASNVGLLLAAAVLLLFGYQFIIMSMREGAISYIAPFRYTGLLWAILLGFLTFGDVPDTAMVVGSAVVVLSGLYTLYRERVRGRTRPAAESAGEAMTPDGM